MAIPKITTGVLNILKNTQTHTKNVVRDSDVCFTPVSLITLLNDAYQVAVKHPQTTFCNYYSSCVRRVVDRNTARCRNNRGEMTKPESGAAARVHFWGNTASALVGIIPTCLKQQTTHCKLL